MHKIKILVVAVASLLSASTTVQSQSSSCQMLGLRFLRYVSVEPGAGVTLGPTTPWDAGPANCANYTTAVITESHPHFKAIHASALTALATGNQVNAYVCGCFSGWGTTLPSVSSFTVYGQ